MLEQIITLFTADSLWSSLAGSIDILAGNVHKYFAGIDNLRAISIILMLIAFLLFLFLIIVLYIKSLLSFMKNDTAKASLQKAEEEFDSEIKAFMDENEREMELERELAKELEMARAEQNAADKNKQKKQEQTLAAEKQKNKEKKYRAEKRQETERQRDNAGKREFYVDFDWKKGKEQGQEENAEPISPDKLQYKQTYKPLSELLGLIVDMLGRGVDDLKIAQTIMFRNQGQNSEDDILQTIDEIKNFIGLAVNKKFARISKEKGLPDEATALYQLALGDTTSALALLEAQMDDNIEKASSLPAGKKRDEIFARTSRMACTFGTLSAVYDTHLATGAFELSIEMAPQNINAWSRAADMYTRAGSVNRAFNAYQNVLNMADEEINPGLIANANKMLAQYYYEQGNNLQAANLSNSSRQYYDSLGINRRLDRQEVEIVEIIEARQRDEIGDTINKILAAKENAGNFRT